MKKLVPFLGCAFLSACITSSIIMGMTTSGYVPPREPSGYVGETELLLRKEMGPPDRTEPRGDLRVLTYYWLSRDAQLALENESAWRGNTAFTPRGLPTTKIPPRNICNLTYTIKKEVVTAYHAAGAGC